MNNTTKIERKRTSYGYQACSVDGCSAPRWPIFPPLEPRNVEPGYCGDHMVALEAGLQRAAVHAVALEGVVVRTARTVTETKPRIERFTATMLCPKCDRSRSGGARLCSDSVEAACPVEEHLHWRCPCGFHWMTWPKDNTHGPAGWYDKPLRQVI